MNQLNLIAAMKRSGFIVIPGLLILLSITVSKAQTISKTMTHEIGINVDNDQPFQTDQYYTAGQDFYYQSLTQARFPFKKKTDSTKTIFTIRFGNKVFNPLNLDTKDTRYMDRPYCGWSYINAEIQNFSRKNSGNFISAQIGVVGPASGMGTLQVWWHETIKLYPVQGWDSQIVNEIVINLNYNHAHAFTLGKGAEIVSGSGAWLGTGSNKLTQEFTLRLFRFNPLSESSFLSSRISKSKNAEQELFFFTSLGADLVFYNIFIQGSLFAGNPSPFTTSINPFYFTTKAGLQYSGKRITATLSFVHLTQETEWVRVHDFASTSLAYRF